MKTCYLFVLLSFSAFYSFAQTDDFAAPWQEVSLDQVGPPAAEDDAYAYLSNYRLLEWAPEQLRPQLAEGRKSKRTINLPLPNGETAQVEIQLDPVMAPGLAERYPEIKTYRILPSAKIRGGRMGWTYQGLHATVHTAEGTVYIDPYLPTDNRYYVSYFVHENPHPESQGGVTCGVTGEEHSVDVAEFYPGPEALEMQDLAKSGGTPIVQRKYRLAVSCTAAFADYHGGTTEGALSAVVTLVNRLNEIFETDLAVRAELVADNDEVLFLTEEEDPFMSEVPGDIMEQNHFVLSSNLGLSSFDYGHVFSRFQNFGQGIARLESVCSQDSKGMGASSRQTPTGDAFAVGLIGHEMGHQFGANHTMGSCHNMNFQTAYEPGSGSTIMSYAGICGPVNGAANNLQSNADPYYHVISLQEIFQHTRLGGGDICPEETDLGNTIPTVELPYENGFFIPISTPFELTAEVTDMEDDPLTYSWEQFDKDTITNPPGQQMGSQSLFRSYPPVESPTRVFPRINRIVNNQNHPHEVLPTYGRGMTFRCTVRDNFPGSGGVAWEEVRFRVDSAAGPFRVLSPNTGSPTWRVGDYREVSWDVANTDGDKVNCRRVNIRLSIDGGYTYPITLLSNTPNDGSAFVTVPDNITSDARIRVEAADNIFFDISNADFSIAPTTEPGYALDAQPYLQNLCKPAPAIVDLVTTSLLEYDSAVTLSLVSALPDGASANLEPATIIPGETAALSLDFGGSDFTGPLLLEIRAVTNDMDTTYREVEVLVVNNNYDELEQVAPFDGEENIQYSTNFSWTELSHVDTYGIEIATSPVFGETVVESSNGLDTTAYIPTNLLEDNSLYYWRIRGNNACGEGPWIGPNVFHTLNTFCQESSAQDTPVTIPGTGPLPTRTSTITVPFDATVSDINIPFVNVLYQPVQNFRISLLSPVNNEVILYGEDVCFGTDRVSIGFDDQAPNEILCPPDDNIVFRPTGELSDFIGENSQGDWRLKVQVLESGFGAPGAIEDWSIEFCATLNPTMPAVLTNETLEVPPGLENPVSSQELEITSTAAGPAQLNYTIVSLPANGTLKFQGQPIAIGDQFSQASINGYNVSYKHDGSATTEDHFTFVVQDGMGGFLPIQTFNIVIDENAVVNTVEVDTADEFSLFPNPTEGEVLLQFAQPTRENGIIRIFNLQGRLLQQSPLPAGSLDVGIELGAYPAGLYLVQFGTQVERVLRF